MPPIASPGLYPRALWRSLWPAASVSSGHQVLLAGHNQRTVRHLKALSARRGKAVHVVGWMDAQPAAAIAAGTSRARVLHKVNDYRHLGDLDSLAKILRSHCVDEVLVTLPIKSCYDKIQSILAVCEQAGVPVSIGTDIFESQIARPNSQAGATGQPERIVYSSVPYPRWKLAVKRLMDVTGALGALALCAIPMLIIALAIKVGSRGPVFFRQERVGRHTRRFQILKFRTMVVDAEKKLDELRHLNEVDGPVFKIQRDPRITSVGRWLRKLSLDELPQFFNVLAGDMSLVGPRPPIPAEVEKYEWWQRRRLSMKPGITCFWQIAGRNEIPFQEWMQLDLRYIDRWSLSLDVKLLLQTIPAVLKARGAS